MCGDARKIFSTAANVKSRNADDVKEWGRIGEVLTSTDDLLI